MSAALFQHSKHPTWCQKMLKMCEGCTFPTFQASNMMSISIKTDGELHFSNIPSIQHDVKKCSKCVRVALFQHSKHPTWCQNARSVWGLHFFNMPSCHYDDDVNMPSCQHACVRFRVQGLGFRVTGRRKATRSGTSADHLYHHHCRRLGPGYRDSIRILERFYKDHIRTQ